MNEQEFKQYYFKARDKICDFISKYGDRLYNILTEEKRDKYIKKFRLMLFEYLFQMYECWTNHGDCIPEQIWINQDMKFEIKFIDLSTPELRILNQITNLEQEAIKNYLENTDSGFYIDCMNDEQQKRYKELHEQLKELKDG